ncbi:unnamed protein product [Rotaria sordida]|uniref:MYND-type domain-containing protein n=1 Tax=Rotaria sordida TaxID=392033 RepID=A0A819VSU2_9BILA|nr:unnamed protein product [Rotaria sordida]
MSSSRLALYEQQPGSSSRFDIDNLIDERYRALQDAKQARNLWPTWWKGHLRVGKVYAVLNDHEKAINSFERALALAPTNNEIQKALYESRQILGRQLRLEHLESKLSPRSIPEQLNELQRNLGLDPEEVRMTYRLLEEIDPSIADVIKGHQYEHGDIDVKQDYEQAAKYFAKAANQGNAEGMYNLARLTDRGLGVKKDHNLAQGLLEQAAAQPPQHPLLEELPNNGVALAEHALGLRHAEGVVVHKNLLRAAYWYQRAVNHGCSEAANNLAIMYEDEPAPIVDRKLRLRDSHRIEVISKHREWESHRNNLDHSVISGAHKPRVKQQTPKSLIGLKSITLREMNPTRDHIYSGYVLSATIIDAAHAWTPSIHLVIEDENLDCEQMCIYGFPEEQGEYLTSKVYTIGSKMNIINPYLRIGASDMKPFIRIDDFSSILVQSESERVINMCRCCGEPNAPYACSKCKQARYCSKECQTMDWQLYKHKLICKN